MTVSRRSASIFAVLLLGVFYAAVGVLFGRLAGAAATHQGVVRWRLAAWLVSGVAFGIHVLIVRRTRGSSIGATALAAAAAAAIGSFGLAVAASMHSHRPMVLALVVWPVITFVPAFLVAAVGGMLLRHR